MEARTREKPTGIHQTFSQSGNPLQEIYYDDKGKRNRERTWGE